MEIFVPGTHNDWKQADPEVRAEMDRDDRYVYTCRLPRGVHRFRFVVEGEWAHDWGCMGTEPLVAPTAGELVPDGTEIVLNAVHPGTFVFTIDEAGNSWSVDTVSDGGGLSGALVSDATLPVELALACTDGESPSPAVVTGLQALLQQPTPCALLPLHRDGRVLLACRAQSWESVVVAASWRGWGDHPIPLQHVAGSDLHVAVAEVPPGVHEYKIVYNGSHWAHDPSNPWVSPDRIPVPKFNLGSFNSILAMETSPLSTGDSFLACPAFYSAILENARDVWVWLPPGYLENPQRRYPTLYLLDGNEAITRTFPHDVVRDAVARGEAEECILVCVAFAAQNERLYEFADPVGRERYAGFFVRELVPYIDSHFRTCTDGSSRGMAGVSLGANFSYYIALRHPEVFGNAAGQGGAWGSGDWELLHVFESEPVRPLRLYMDSSRPAFEGGENDASKPSVAMETALARLGYAVTHVQHVGEDHDWPSWKNRLPELIRWFAPPQGVESCAESIQGEPQLAH